MSILSKIFIVLLVVLTIALSVAVVLVHHDYLKHIQAAEHFKAKYKDATLAFQGEQARTEKVERKLNEQIVSLDTTVAAQRDQLGNLQNAVKKANALVDEKEQELANAKLEVTRLSGVAKQATVQYSRSAADLSAMKTKNERLQKDYDQVTKTLIDTEAQKSYLLRQVKVQQEQIERLQKQPTKTTGTEQPGVVPRLAGGAVAGPPIKGRVTAVDDEMATINVGSVDGVQPGMRFTVFRKHNYLATLVISRVGESLSVGRLELVKQRVQVNDSAWNRLEEN